MTEINLTKINLKQNGKHNHVVRCQALVKTHQGQIRAFLRRMCLNEALADDLAQDTFLRAFQHMHQIDDNDKAKSWLFQIAYRIFLDHIRKNKRRQILMDDNMPISQTTQAGPSGIKMDIEHAMNTLSPEQRAAVILCLSYGFSHPEAAQALGQPLGTIKSNIARAKHQLRSLLDAYEPGRLKSGRLQKGMIK